MDTDEGELLHRGLDGLDRISAAATCVRSPAQYPIGSPVGDGADARPHHPHFSGRRHVHVGLPSDVFRDRPAAARHIQSEVNKSSVGPPGRVLDLPCGFGRVLRYFRALWPNAELVAGELVSDAVSYCQQTFNARPLQSREPLWEADIGRGYDLIWSGSLLTHFDEDHWQPTLEHFAHALSDSGLLIFSTIGRGGYDRLQGKPPANAAQAAIIRMSPHNMSLEATDVERLVDSVSAGRIRLQPLPKAP